MWPTKSGLNIESVLISIPYGMTYLYVPRLAHVHGEYGVLCDLLVVWGICNLKTVLYLGDWNIKVK